MQTVDVHVKVDPSGKIATIWGRTQTTSSQAAESSLTIQTDLRPTSAINIIPPGIVYGVDNDGKMNRNMAVNSITLSTSGVLSIRNINWADSSSSNKCMSLIFPVTIVL